MLDVAASGVPGSEQTQEVFVKSLPVATLGDGARRAEKPKTSVAAAKAQDLFAIWYSSIGQTAPPASASSNHTNDAFEKQRCPAETTMQQVHSKTEPQNQSQPPALNTSPGREVWDGSPPAPNIQIAPVWSLEPNLSTEASPPRAVETLSLSPNSQPSRQSQVSSAYS